MRSSRFRALRVAAVLLALPAGAENLLVDGDFDSGGPAAWTIDAPGGFSGGAASGWPAGASTAGEVFALNDAAAANVYRAMHQCVPVQPNARYLISLYTRFASNNLTTGRAVLNVVTHTSPDCSGPNVFLGSASVASDAPDWGHGSALVTSSGSAASATVAVLFGKDQAGGELDAWIDAVYFGSPVKGDFNDDGHSDLLFDDLSSDSHRVWTMGGYARVASLLVTPDADGPDWQLAAADNFDADGRSDLVFRDRVSGDVQFWLMNGVVRASVAPLGGAAPPPANWTLTASADFDHDGQADLLWRNETSQRLAVWTLNGTVRTGALAPDPDHAVDANWAVVVAGDLDSDGNVDLLWYNSSSGKIVRWLMDASVHRLSGDFTSPPNAGNSNWKVVAAGQLKHVTEPPVDSLDFVWRNSSSGKLVVWLMDDTGLKRTGGFTSPDSPTPALGWTVAGPR